MPHEVALTVYRNGQRVVIGSALVNEQPGPNGEITMIARIKDEMIVRHLSSGGNFGTAELCLGEAKGSERQVRVIKSDI